MCLKEHERRSKESTRRTINLWCVLEDTSRSIVISYLNGWDNMVLNKSILHGYSRRLLHAAYKGVSVHNFEFLVHLPTFDNREEDKETLCEGMLWAQSKGIVARNFVLKIPNNTANAVSRYHPKSSHLKVLIEYKRRMIVIHMVKYCHNTYDFQVFENGWAFIHRAASFGDAEMMSLLCQREDVTDLNIPDRINENSPLHIAAAKRNRGSLVALIQAKANVNALDRTNKTPLHHAIATGKKQNQAIPVVRALLDAGADINALDAENRSPMDMVKSNTQLCQELLHFLRANHGLPGEVLLGLRTGQRAPAFGGPLPRSHSPRSDTMSNHSLNSSFDTIVLPNTTHQGLDSTVLPSAPQHVHPLSLDEEWHMANEQGLVGKVMTLLRHGAGVDATFPDGSSPLLWAVVNGQERIVSVLLSRGANPNQADLNGTTPLHYAARSGNVRLVSVLIASGARMNALDRYGRTALAVAEDANVQSVGSHKSVLDVLAVGMRNDQGRSSQNFTLYGK